MFTMPAARARNHAKLILRCLYSPVWPAEYGSRQNEASGGRNPGLPDRRDGALRDSALRDGALREGALSVRYRRPDTTEVTCMRIVALLVAGLVAGFLTLQSAPAQAGVVARIDISQQRMRVYVNGRHAYTWKVSTGGAATAPPRAAIRSSGCTAPTTRASTTARRCPTRCSSAAATRFTAPATSASSAARQPRLRAAAPVKRAPAVQSRAPARTRLLADRAHALRPGKPGKSGKQRKPDARAYHPVRRTSAAWLPAPAPPACIACLHRAKGFSRAGFLSAALLRYWWREFSPMESVFA